MASTVQALTKAFFVGSEHAAEFRNSAHGVIEDLRSCDLELRRCPASPEVIETRSRPCLTYFPMENLLSGPQTVYLGVYLFFHHSVHRPRIFTKARLELYVRRPTGACDTDNAKQFRHLSDNDSPVGVIASAASGR